MLHHFTFLNKTTLYQPFRSLIFHSSIVECVSRAEIPDDNLSDWFVRISGCLRIQVPNVKAGTVKIVTKMLCLQRALSSVLVVR